MCTIFINFEFICFCKTYKFFSLHYQSVSSAQQNARKEARKIGEKKHIGEQRFRIRLAFSSWRQTDWMRATAKQEQEEEEEKKRDAFVPTTMRESNCTRFCLLPVTRNWIIFIRKTPRQRSLLFCRCPVRFHRGLFPHMIMTLLLLFFFFYLCESVLCVCVCGRHTVHAWIYIIRRVQENVV